jgi:Ca2+-binding EF-hand superfamily protein
MFSDTECDVDSIKVIDFGLSQKFARNEHLRDAVGTVYTMSPELLTGDYTEKNDVWSVGVICFMLLSSSMPFYGRDRAHVIRRIISGRYSFASRQWRQVSPGAKAFVTSLLELDPDKRPSALDAWKSDWLQGSDDLPSDVENSNMDRIQANVQAFAEYSKLKRLALMVIAYKSTDDEIGILKRMFSRFDRNQNGDITLADFKSTLSGYYNYTDEELEHMFNGIDIDGTGKVHYTEFLAATVESNGSIDEERLAEAFDRIDTDCTGYITVSDLQDFLGPGIPEAYLDAMIDECDVNRDHKISYEEFLSLWNVEADQRLAQANASVHSRRLDSRHNSFDSTYLESNSSLMSSEGSSTLFPDGSHHRVPVLMGQKHNNGRHDGLEVGCGTLAFQKHKRELSNRAPLVA